MRMKSMHADDLPDGGAKGLMLSKNQKSQAITTGQRIILLSRKTQIKEIPILLFATKPDKCDKPASEGTHPRSQIQGAGQSWSLTSAVELGFQGPPAPGRVTPAG